MANPRKFSDKLEIIRRKEEEANAAFEEIMREVSDARTGSPGAHPHHPHPGPWYNRGQQSDKMMFKYRGGSLPNVLRPVPVEGMNIYNEVYGQNQTRSYGPSMGHIRRTMDPPSGPIFPSKNKPRSNTVTAPYPSTLLPQPAPAVIAEQQHDNSSWRRTYSDSAIQQSLQQPPKKIHEDSLLAQCHETSAASITTGGPRIIQTPATPLKPGISSFQSQFSDSPPTKSHMQAQANTNSLPDLTNLSIPSPIQNPIDNENTGIEKNNQEPVNPFQVPYRVPPSRAIPGKQIYSRQLNQSNPDMMDPKLQLNLYSRMEKSDLSSSLNSNPSVSHAGPISPVTPPPYFWNSTPMSPLAAEGMMQSQNGNTGSLQQQLQQLIQNENPNDNGMPPPPAYPYMQGNAEASDNFINYLSNSYPKHGSLYRMNSGPAHMNSLNSVRERELKSNQLCDRQLDSALMKVKSQNGNELSEDDLNSVRVALNPLNFNDVQILNENTELVDQSAEEQFRLERAGF